MFVYLNTFWFRIRVNKLDVSHDVRLTSRDVISWHFESHCTNNVTKWHVLCNIHTLYVTNGYYYVTGLPYLKGTIPRSNPRKSKNRAEDGTLKGGVFFKFLISPKWRFNDNKGGIFIKIQNLSLWIFTENAHFTIDSSSKIPIENLSGQLRVILECFSLFLTWSLAINLSVFTEFRKLPRVFIVISNFIIFMEMRFKIRKLPGVLVQFSPHDSSILVVPGRSRPEGDLGRGPFEDQPSRPTNPWFKHPLFS